MTTLTRRAFGQWLGAGLVVAVAAPRVRGQAAPNRRQGGGGRGAAKPIPIAARLHVGADGVITVMTGKVECGQGSRAELTQAAAEELRVPPESIQLIMADTALVPDDGLTAGSGTTPRTVPAVRQGAAAAREALVGVAATLWGVEGSAISVKGGVVSHAASGKSAGYAELAGAAGAADALQKVAGDVTLTSVKEWKVMGTPVARPNRNELVTGKHTYPSDVTRPGTLHAKVLRPPACDAKLTAIDLSAAKGMAGVVVVQEGDFVAFAAPTRFAAEQALTAAAKTATWQRATGQPSSEELTEYLPKHAKGGVPANPFGVILADAAKKLRQQYDVAYVQHAPMEPRTACAEWEADHLTVWTGTQNPFGVRGELARAFKIDPALVRVIVPDFGGGFGGKHSGEAALEAARIAKVVGKPVSLRWTRQEEFTWAYFRPAGVIFAEASLDAAGKLTSWHFINVNSGPSSIETPYDAGKSNCHYVNSDPPLRPGSYRGLAATANTFAREAFMDELAAIAGQDPLAFRLAHLKEARLRAVMEKAAAEFGWVDRRKTSRAEGTGIGLACGTEKNSFVAACAEVRVDAKQAIHVTHVTMAFECGAIVNPANLLMQVQGSLVMGLGPALREAIRFKDGQVLNDSFGEYKVPRFADVPEMAIHLVDRKDLPSSGAGETPIIAVAPAVANAVFDATGERVRSMPMRLDRA